MNTFKWLLKREFWENRGGFVWAPVITAAIYLFFNLVGLVLVAVGLRRAETTGDFNLGHGMAELADPARAGEVSRVLEMVFLGLGAPLYLVVAVVVFFYCLGSLYDDRKDRSILFWKSLPVSDAQTVLSKVVMALFVAPAIATVAAIATSFLLLAIMSAFIAAHGANPMYLWDVGAIARAVFNQVAALPVYALWALPTVGWLMLCSAFFRRVPFIWATLIPVLAGIMVWILGLGAIIERSVTFVWVHIVLRVLSGTLPGIDIPYRLAWFPEQAQGDTPEQVAAIFSAGQTYTALAMPALWIGAAIGVLMIFAAIQLRRRTDEG